MQSAQCGMFVLPAIVEAVLLPSLPDPVPSYEQIRLSAALFCASWHFVVALPIVMVLFTVAAFTVPPEHTGDTVAFGWRQCGTDAIGAFTQGCVVSSPVELKLDVNHFVARPR